MHGSGLQEQKPTFDGRFEMKSTRLLQYGHRLDWRWFRSASITALEVGLLALVLSGATGCSVLERFTASAPPPTVPPPVITVPGEQPAVPQPSPTPEPTFTPQPTYTPLPTYTPFPTFTPLPTYTPVPTFTAQPVYVYPSPVPPSPIPATGGCCTLRVRNVSKVTFWIGTVLPYGGNYIKPRHYVEFYPHKPTWMRIWWCRYRQYYNDPWDDNDPWWDDDNPWNNHHYYNCRHTDVYVNETFEQISVR